MRIYFCFVFSVHEKLTLELCPLLFVVLHYWSRLPGGGGPLTLLKVALVLREPAQSIFEFVLA